MRASGNDDFQAGKHLIFNVKNINIFTRALIQGFVLEPLIKTGCVSAIQIEQALCIALNLHYL